MVKLTGRDLEEHGELFAKLVLPDAVVIRFRQGGPAMFEKFVALFPVLVPRVLGRILSASVLALVFVLLKRRGYLRPFVDLFLAVRRLSLVGGMELEKNESSRRNDLIIAQKRLSGLTPVGTLFQPRTEGLTPTDKYVLRQRDFAKNFCLAKD